jgi:hypothetical protein
MAEKVVSQRKKNGTVEVWARGWIVRFPSGDKEPEVEGGEPPAGLSENSVDLKVTLSESATFVRHGSWVVELRKAQYTVTSSAPTEEDDGHVYYYESL